MTSDLRRLLVEAGLASPGSPLYDVRLDDGPSGVRGSCWSTSGCAWIERGKDGPLSKAIIEALRTSVEGVPSVSEAIRLPFIAYGDIAVYGPLDTDRLMIDALFPGDPPSSEWPTLETDCAALGAVLAQLHLIRPRGPNATALLRDDPALRRLRSLVHRGAGDPCASLALERLQEHLVLGFPRLAAAVREVVDAPAAAPSVLLHGRFSPAFVMRDSASGDGGPTIIGWTEAQWGPAAWDLGWFLGELLELRAAWTECGDIARGAALTAAAVAFLRGYFHGEPVDGNRLRTVAAHSALKIVHHLWQSATFIAYDYTAFDHLLQTADEALDIDWTAVSAGSA